MDTDSPDPSDIADVSSEAQDTSSDNPSREDLDLLAEIKGNVKHTFDSGLWWSLTVGLMLGLIGYLGYQYYLLGKALAGFVDRAEDPWYIAFSPLPVVLIFAVVIFLAGIVFRNRYGNRMMAWFGEKMRKAPVLGFIFLATRAYVRSYRPDSGRQVMVIDPDDRSIRSAQMTARYKWNEELQKAEPVPLDSEFNPDSKELCTVYLSTAPLPRFGELRTIHSCFIVVVDVSFQEWLRSQVSCGTVTDYSDPVYTPVMKRMRELGMLEPPKKGDL